LFALEDQRGGVLDRAEDLLAVGRWEEAYQAARQADEMRRDQESLRLRAVTALLAHDFHGAWECYRAARKGVPDNAGT
jgi:hypothetical protein